MSRWLWEMRQNGRRMKALGNFPQYRSGRISGRQRSLHSAGLSLVLCGRNLLHWGFCRPFRGYEPVGIKRSCASFRDLMVALISPCSFFIATDLWLCWLFPVRCAGFDLAQFSLESASHACPHFCHWCGFSALTRVLLSICPILMSMDMTRL